MISHLALTIPEGAKLYVASCMNRLAVRICKLEPISVCRAAIRQLKGILLSLHAASIVVFARCGGLTIKDSRILGPSQSLGKILADALGPNPCNWALYRPLGVNCQLQQSKLPAHHGSRFLETTTPTQRHEAGFPSSPIDTQ